MVRTLPLGTKTLPSANREQVEGATSLVAGNICFEETTDSVSRPSVQELTLSLEAGITQAGLIRALGDLQAYIGLGRLVLRAPHLRLGDSEQMVAVQTLSGVVIRMSLVTHLSLPGDLVTEYLLLHIALLPLLESFVVFPAPLMSDLSGEGSGGFGSLRLLDVPDANFLRRFSSYQNLDLETLKVGGLSRNSLSIIARNFAGLRRVSIEGTGFKSSEIFVLGACFQLEEIEILTQRPLGMDNEDLHQFRTMFRNLRSLSIKMGEKDHTRVSRLDLDTGSFF